MPSSAQILADLGATAQGAIPVAAIWHVILAVVGIALVLGWRPSQRRAGQLLAAPLASVALVAAAFGNPFNGIVFALLAIAQVTLARRGSPDPVHAAPAVSSAIGILMVGIGWIYPHFLADHASSVYFYAAPLGVVPCPTLYAVVGLALLGGGGSPTASRVIAVAGLFYGVTGVLQLGVRLDLGLVIGAAALATMRAQHPRAVGATPA